MLSRCRGSWPRHQHCSNHSLCRESSGRRRLPAAVFRTQEWLLPSRLCARGSRPLAQCVNLPVCRPHVQSTFGCANLYLWPSPRMWTCDPCAIPVRAMPLAEIRGAGRRVATSTCASHQLPTVLGCDLPESAVQAARCLPLPTPLPYPAPDPADSPWQLRLARVQA